MNYTLKKSLYESIMRNVAKEVKNALNGINENVEVRTFTPEEDAAIAAFVKNMIFGDNKTLHESRVISRHYAKRLNESQKDGLMHMRFSPQISKYIASTDEASRTTTKDDEIAYCAGIHYKDEFDEETQTIGKVDVENIDDFQRRCVRSLVDSVIKLAVNILNKKYGIWVNEKMTADDYFQAACIGITKYAYVFNPFKNIDQENPTNPTFGKGILGYITTAVRDEQLKCLDSVGVSKQARLILTWYYNTINKMIEDNKPVPSDDELYSMLKASNSRYAHLGKNAFLAAIDLSRSKGSSVSFDTTTGGKDDDKGRTLGEILPDAVSASQSVEAEYEEKMLENYIISCIRRCSRPTLVKNYTEAIFHYLGVFGRELQTAADAAAPYGWGGANVKDKAKQVLSVAAQQAEFVEETDPELYDILKPWIMNLKALKRQHPTDWEKYLRVERNDQRKLKSIKLL